MKTLQKIYGIHGIDTITSEIITNSLNLRSELETIETTAETVHVCGENGYGMGMGNKRNYRRGK